MSGIDIITNQSAGLDVRFSSQPSESTVML